MGVGRSEEEEAGARFWVLVIAPRTRAGPSSFFRFRGCQGLLVLLLLRFGSRTERSNRVLLRLLLTFFWSKTLVGAKGLIG